MRESAPAVRTPRKIRLPREVRQVLRGELGDVLPRALLVLQRPRRAFGSRVAAERPGRIPAVKIALVWQ